MTDDATLAANLAESVRANAEVLAQALISTVREEQMAADAEALAGMKAAVSTAQAARDQAIADKEASDGLLLVANATIKDLQAKLDAATGGTTTPPPATKTLFGGNKPSQTSSGRTLQDQADVVAKWGDGAAMRQFFGSYTTTIAPRHPGLGRLHASWNFPIDDTVAALKTKIASVAKNMLPGDMVETRHEGDSKVRGGTYTLAEFLAHKANFYDAVKAVRPDLEVPATYTAWLFNPTSKLDATPYLTVKADWIGIDYDGVKDTAYFDYSVLFANVMARIKKAGYKGAIVPEFGWPQATSDADDSKRAAEMTRHAKALIATGYAQVCLFEAPTDGYPYRTTAKTQTAWKAFTP